MHSGLIVPPPHPEVLHARVGLGVPGRSADHQELRWRDRPGNDAIAAAQLMLSITGVITPRCPPICAYAAPGADPCTERRRRPASLAGEAALSRRAERLERLWTVLKWAPQLDAPQQRLTQGVRV